jgi:hypothetical protein
VLSTGESDLLSEFAEFGEVGFLLLGFETVSTVMQLFLRRCMEGTGMVAVEVWFLLYITLRRGGTTGLTFWLTGLASLFNSSTSPSSRVMPGGSSGLMIHFTGELSLMG